MTLSLRALRDAAVPALIDIEDFYGVSIMSGQLVFFVKDQAAQERCEERLRSVRRFSEFDYVDSPRVRYKFSSLA